MLDIRNVRVTFGDVTVLHGIDLAVEQGEILCLLGPSGCGKTTLLRVIAGLEMPQSGDVLADGESITQIPVHKRGFGLMFQDFALFPHLNVAQNVAFGLKMGGEKLTDQNSRVRDVLELVGLSGLGDRDTTELSGGERQRVALARSLAPNPRLLMLDEPLGALDALLRERLIAELRDIIKRIGLTAIYVTHDQHEAFVIADRIALMNAGQIEQIGTPQQVYQKPVSPFVAQFLGLNNLIPILNQEDGIAHTSLGNFKINHRADMLLLHPEGIQLAAPETPDTFMGIVSTRTFLGDTYRIVVLAGNNQAITFKLPSLATVLPQPGEKVAISVRPESVIPLISP